MNCLFIVDMVNGFAKNGNLYSDRIESILPKLTSLAKNFKNNNLSVYALNDFHTESSKEFDTYPQHCISGSDECEICDELKPFITDEIKKNSTNGFLSPYFEKYKSNLLNDSKIYITGNCTDICVLQFALSLNAYISQNNGTSLVYVVTDLTATFDAPFHSGDEFQSIALKLLSQDGIKLITSDDIIF